MFFLNFHIRPANFHIFCCADGVMASCSRFVLGVSIFTINLSIIFLYIFFLGHLKAWMRLEFSLNWNCQDKLESDDLIDKIYQLVV